MREAEPIGFLVGAWLEGSMHSATFTTDRAEAHRIYHNAERLDDEVCAAVSPPVESMRIVLANVYDEGELYRIIATDLPAVEP